MGNISSVNLKSSQKFNPYHNVDIRPSYAMLTDANNVNLFRTNNLESLRLKKQIIKAAEQSYEAWRQKPREDGQKKRAPKFKAKSYEWSAVVNLNETHTAQDLQKLVDYFANTHGFQCYQAVIHRDEGHLVENETGLVWQSAKHFFFDKETGIYYKGECKNPNAEIEKQIWKKSDEILAQNIDELTKQFEIKINHHAHLEFITLDKETGKNRKTEIHRGKLSQMQTDIAKILGMQRGENYYENHKEAKEQGKKIVKPNRMEGRAYATISTNKNRKLSAQKEAERAQNREREQKIGNTLDSALEYIENKKVQITNLGNQINAKDNEIATLRTENEVLKSAQSTNKAFEKAFKTLDREFGVNFEPNIPQSAQNYINKFKEIANERDLAKDKIAELEAKIKELEAERKAERVQMIAENKALQEQGKDKIYTQQDHQNLKKQYDTQIAELKTQISELKNAEQKNTELQVEIDAKDEKIAELEEERRNVIIEFVKHQNWVDFYKKIPENIGDLIEFCEKVVNRLIELQNVNEAWEQYFKENFQNDDSNTEQNDTPEKTQNELSTNAQNDDSNTKIFKKR